MAPRLAIYGLLSTSLFLLTTLSALSSRPNFFSAAVAISRSSGSVMVMANFGVFGAILCGLGVRRVFFGRLRGVEYEVSRHEHPSEARLRGGETSSGASKLHEGASKLCEGVTVHARASGVRVRACKLSTDSGPTSRARVEGAVAPHLDSDSGERGRVEVADAHIMKTQGGR